MKEVKLVLVGDHGVGKTSLVTRCSSRSFRANQAPTVVVDFHARTMTIDGQQLKLNIWDTAGEEKYAPIVKTYFRGAQGVMVVCAMNDPDSFEHVARWISKVRDELDDVPIVLVGNKCDLPAQVEHDMLILSGEGLHVDAFLCSALSGTGVEQAFEQLARMAAERVVCYGRMADDVAVKDMGRDAVQNGGRCWC